MNALLRFAAGIVIPLVLAISASAQVVPTTPTKFDMRRLGDASSSSAGVSATPKPPQTTYREVTYISLSPLRQWKSTDGKSLLGKLIAFEDFVVTTTGAAPDPKAAAPQMPAKPTVVRDGKARLLIESKAFEVPLERLGEEERKFIEQLQTAIAGKK